MSFVAEIQANIDDFQKNLDKAQARLDIFATTVGQKIAKIGSNFQMIGGAISIGVTAPLTAAGVAAFNMAADFEDALGATDQIFKEASESTKQWADSLPTYFGIAKQEALEYSNMMGSMLVNIGNLTEKEASKQSAKLIELAGDLTAMYGGTTQEAVRALTGALKGNNTMLDNYGMAANDALVKAKALSMGLVEQGKEMSLSAKQAATLALIYEQSGAAQGQAAREAEGASGSMRAFRTEITNLTTELGAVLLPIITPLINRLKDMAAGFRSLSPETQKMIVYIGGAVAALGPFMVALGSIMKLAPLVGTAFSVMTGPIGIAVAAIAAAAVVIIKNWDSIRAYFTSGNGAKIWESISASAKKLWTSLTTIFNQIRTVVIAIWDKIGSNLTAIWNSTLGIIVNVVDGAFGAIADVFGVFADLLRGDFKGALIGVQNLFTTVFSTINKIAINAIAGISQYVAGFLKLVGADSLGSSLEGWANKLVPVKVETQEVAKAVEASNVALTSKGGRLKEVTTELGKTAKATKDYKRELTEALATMGYYDAALASIGYRYTDLSKLAKQAGADATTLGRIAREELGEKLTLALGQTDGLKEVSPKLKITPTFDIDIDSITEKMKEQAKVIASNVKGIIVDSLTIDIGSVLGELGASAMQSLGEALASGANFVDVIGKGLLSSLGNLAVSVGKQMMAFGTAALGLQKLMTNPYLAIAAGAALVALGSLASASVSKTISSGTSGSNASSYGSSVTASMPNYFQGAYSDNNTVVFEIAGDKLRGVLEKVDRRNNRTR